MNNIEITEAEFLNLQEMEEREIKELESMFTQSSDQSITISARKKLAKMVVRTEQGNQIWTISGIVHTSSTSLSPSSQSELQQ